jgi:hypothetical protein
VLTQLIPWSFNHFVRDAEWASISPAVWWTNLQNPWQWDNNAFLNNQFSHPYHGSLYYNVGRTNGFNFWESSLWSFGGSFMWEIMGEQWAPAPNDLLNTGLGGITLGEMLFRASSLVLDNRATGFERTMREIGAFALDRCAGSTGCSTGQMNDCHPESGGLAAQQGPGIARHGDRGIPAATGARGRRIRATSSSSSSISTTAIRWTT